MWSISQSIPADLAAAATVSSTFSAYSSAYFLYSMGVYPSSLGANESTLNGSVIVRAVIPAPISLAKRTPCSTALAARSDPSVAMRMFLNNVAPLLSCFFMRLFEISASVDDPGGLLNAQLDKRTERRAR